MNPTINLVLRGLCLLAYALALAHLAGVPGAGGFDRAPLVAGVLLVLHAAETVFVLRHLRAYRGPLAVSVLLSLLFGVLHWKPLAAQRPAAPRKD